MWFYTCLIIISISRQFVSLQMLVTKQNGKFHCAPSSAVLNYTYMGLLSSGENLVMLQHNIHPESLKIEKGNK